MYFRILKRAADLQSPVMSKFPISGIGVALGSNHPLAPTHGARSARPAGWRRTAVLSDCWRHRPGRVSPRGSRRAVPGHATRPK